MENEVIEDIWIVTADLGPVRASFGAVTGLRSALD